MRTITPHNRRQKVAALCAELHRRLHEIEGLVAHAEPFDSLDKRRLTLSRRVFVEKAEALAFTLRRPVKE